MKAYHHDLQLLTAELNDIAQDLSFDLSDETDKYHETCESIRNLIQDVKDLTDQAVLERISDMYDEELGDEDY